MEPTPKATNKGAPNLVSSTPPLPISSSSSSHLGAGSQMMASSSCGVSNRSPTLNSSFPCMPVQQGEGSFALHAFRLALPPLGPLAGQCPTLFDDDDMSDKSDDAVASPSEFAHYLATDSHQIVTTSDFDPHENNVCKMLGTSHL